ncbi:MAG: DUF1127 domain-containing protein [Paracoccaceae bacterium]
MAAFDTTRPVYGSASIAGQFASFFTLVMDKVISWNDARMTRKTLLGLSDRQLEDIGLIRGDVDAMTNRF